MQIIICHSALTNGTVGLLISLITCSETAVPIRIGSVSLYFPDVLFGEDRRRQQSSARLLHVHGLPKIMAVAVSQFLNCVCLKAYTSKHNRDTSVLKSTLVSLACHILSISLLDLFIKFSNLKYLHKSAFK